MTGRGIDQILPTPSDPVLYESYVKDARAYVEFAEAANGPIESPVDFPYIWGAALDELDQTGPDARVINLETSVTRSRDPWPGKGIHYRMHPDNVRCLQAARVDCCVLANNHVLDWGYAGLDETLRTLRGAGLHVAGAGSGAEEAGAPATIDLGDRGRLLVFAYGSVTSGIPLQWRAGDAKRGINVLTDLSDATARRVVASVERSRGSQGLVVVSVHWGSNWGYAIPREQRQFAHTLIDSGSVDIVHGHSSHHAKGIEVYRGRPILYGCGDFLNDYEGIGGHEQYRGDLSLMYLVGMDTAGGGLVELRLIPLQMRRFSLQRATRVDAEWLRATLDRESAAFGCRVEYDADHGLRLRPPARAEGSAIER